MEKLNEVRELEKEVVSHLSKIGKRGGIGRGKAGDDFDFKGVGNQCVLRWGYWRRLPEDVEEHLSKKFIVTYDQYEDDDGGRRPRILVSYIIKRKNELED